MPKMNVIQKEKKRFFLFNKFYKKKNSLKNEIRNRIKNNKNRSFFDNLDILKKIQRLPKDSHGIRCRNRCYLTGRARGVYRRFGLSRCAIREKAGEGVVPGIFKCSW